MGLELDSSEPGSGVGMSRSSVMLALPLTFLAGQLGFVRSHASKDIVDNYRTGHKHNRKSLYQFSKHNSSPVS